MSLKSTTKVLGLIGCAGLVSTAVAGERDLQFSVIVPDSQVIALFNSGDEPIALDGWRFCTHNTSQVRRYTSSSAFNGITVPASSSISVHLQNNANPEIPTQFNASDLGSFADFELAAYAMSFYFPGENGSVSFGNGNLIADHLQWSLGGVDNSTADERSDEAEAGGVWTDQTQWISVRTDSLLIELVDPTNAVLHGPEDYNVISSCPADMTDDGELNFFDVSAFLTAFGSMDLVADFSQDGQLNFFDVSIFLSQFGAGCP
jgi:hypothetical protein